MHWSKTRHVDYTSCPRRFFYSAIAALRNPSIRALQERQSPPLIRHDLVRNIIRAILHADNWTEDQLSGVIEGAKETLQTIIDKPLIVNSEMSIVESCLTNFAEHVLPSLRQERILYISDGDPIEFVYTNLTMMALPEVVVDKVDEVNIIYWKTGSSDFRKEEQFDLRVGGLTCWSRSVLQCVDRPTCVSEVFLREYDTIYSKTFSDEQVRHFVRNAKQVATDYNKSAKIRDFPAKPDLHTCRFCRFQSICPEWKEYAEVDYTLETLSLARAGDAREQALNEVRGEVRPVYLCHASEDKENFVRPFSRALEAKGIRFWFDEAELLWGDSLSHSINKGLAISDYIICFISDAFLERGWPQAEMNAGMTQEIGSGEKKVLPILLADPEKVFDECPILRDKIYKKWTDGIENIVAFLERVLEESRHQNDE